jgi:F-type H+-transporting ATPase subunit delta
MDRNRVTVRYAKALLEYATEQKVLERIHTDIRLVFRIMEEHKGFTNYILNPGAPSGEKFRKVYSLLSKELSELTLRFLEMVFTRNREEYLKDICRNFLEMAKKAQGILTAHLTIAQPLDDSVVHDIISKFEVLTKSTIEMETTIDPDLIGGFVFTIDGWQYDASIASKLTSIKKQLQLK